MGVKSVVITSGGAKAAAAASHYLSAGAQVSVIAAEITAALEDLFHRGLIDWQARDPRLSDLDEADLIVTARSIEAPETPTTAGRVTLVGGGPGHPGLLTVAGREALESADVVVADRLAPLSSLAELRHDVEVIDVAKIPGGRSTSQEQINALLIDHAHAGRNVVRFKGGDSFVFGRGGEEVNACRAAGVEVAVIPGVTSAIAAAAAADIPVTHRGVSQGFSVISGHVPPGHRDSTLDYSALAQAGTTIVVLMGVRTLGSICAALMEAGMPSETPAAVVADGTLPSQVLIRGSVETIDDLASQVKPPAIAVIGHVAATELP